MGGAIYNTKGMGEPVKLLKIDSQDLDRSRSCDYRAYGSDPPWESGVLTVDCDLWPVGAARACSCMEAATAHAAIADVGKMLLNLGSVTDDFYVFSNLIIWFLCIF